MAERQDSVQAETTEEEGAISASKVRGGLVELEAKTAKVLQTMENMTVTDSNQPNLLPPVLIPGLLHSEKKDSVDIMSSLEQMISFADLNSGSAENVEGDYLFPPLDEVSQLALVSHSVAAYLHHLRRGQLVRLTTKIYTDTNRWLSHIFRFVDGVSTYHHDPTESIVRTLRLAIMARHPVYSEAGAQALNNVSVYVCEESAMLSLQFACKQLGLSLDSIRMVPQNTTPNSSGGVIGTMDVSILQKLILADVANNRQPLMAIASVGTPIMGSVDSIARIYDICKAHSVWLHCQGHCLAALATSMGAGEIKTCDSMSLNIASWLGIPSLPVVLLHRPVQNVAFADLESDPVISRRLSSLPLWTSLQALGRDTISERILMAFEACRVVQDIVSKCYGIRILSRQSNTGNSIVDLVNEPLNPTLLFETAQCVVVFQFDATTVVQTDVNKETLAETALSQSSDRLNVWLGEILQRDCPGIDLEILDHPIYGTIIRFCPMELGMGVSVPTVESLRNFAESLHGQVDILMATEHHKVTFRKLLENHRMLRFVDLPEWAGLGGVRYIPEGWPDIVNEDIKNELNKLNADLVDHLRATDSAFALGEGTDGFVCVKFGMVTIETDVDELLQLVITCGVRVQENSRILDSMAEIVKKGIETVTADLQRESEEKLWQEGILRHIPVVGRMVNWWSPVAKEAGIKGRSLNLTHGLVESTENIYRYHMQMTGAERPGNKSPPPPMVQQSVSTGSASHSRNVSQSSANSATNTGQAQQQAVPVAVVGKQMTTTTVVVDVPASVPAIIPEAPPLDSVTVSTTTEPDNK